MTDKLTLYNLSLQHLEQDRIGSLTQAGNARRTLDDNFQHAVKYSMEQGLWAFMLRTVQIDASTTLIPGASWNTNDAPASPPQPSGYQFAFELAIDWVRTVQVSTSPTFQPPLTQYTEEAGYLFANFTPIYQSYVSDDPNYGFNLGAWPESFTALVAIVMARLSCKRITGSTDLLKGPDGLTVAEKAARIRARSLDAMNLPPGFAPESSWVRSRRGYGSSGGDNGPIPPGGF